MNAQVLAYRRLEYDPNDHVGEITRALDDAACRALLAASGEPRTVQELAEQCELPLSTAYRKLDQLTGAGLLIERTLIRSSGHHASQYARRFEEVHIDLDGGDDIRLTVVPRQGPDPAPIAFD